MQEAKYNLPRAYFKKFPKFIRVIDVNESFLLIKHIMIKVLTKVYIIKTKWFIYKAQELRE
ncbi:hypothetical protein CN471_30200 [Bacillus thuringiensis]|nr:hypothetical protein CN471_30200 [Bacillus thuringiensis]